MVKKIIEYESPSCDIRYENTETIERISETMEAIEKYFYDMKITAQKFENYMLQSEYVIDTSRSVLKSITVNLDYASDEFCLELEQPITRQVFDGIAKQTNIITVEVVTEGIAEDNDHDFLSYEELEDYEVGGTNSYYNTLGTIKRTTGESTYYYREM